MTTPSSSEASSQHSSYDWVRSIDPNLAKLDSIPLTGSFPSFPWEEFSLGLARTFDREGLAVKPGEVSWRAKDDLLEGLEGTSFPLAVSIPSLKGQVSWVMPAQEIPMLATLLLTKDFHPSPLDNRALSESFYHFFALEVLYQFNEALADPSLTPLLTDPATLPNQDSLCIDISLKLQNHTIDGRLIVSPEFRLSWVDHFARKQKQPPFSQELAQAVDATIHLVAGSTHLSLADWMQVQMGDFIILDNCSFDPDTLTGRLLLTINDKQIFQAKYKEGMLKILQLPQLREAETSMAEQHDDPDELDDDLESSDENDDESSDENDDFSEDEDLFSDADDDLFSEEEEDAESKEESEVLELKEESEKEEKTEEASNGQREASEEEPSPSETSRLIAPEEIPISLVVEIGKVHLTMAQLLSMEPGNLLETDIHKDDKVNLTVNGKRVGKGELIRIGDVIGVRVVQIGR